MQCLRAAAAPDQPPALAWLLDLGCGTGLASRAWLDLSAAQQLAPPAELLLVDQAPAMVERARHLLLPRHRSVRGLVLDAFASDALAAVGEQLSGRGPGLLLSSYALQWHPEPLAVLTRCWAPWLRPGDWLAVAAPDDRSFTLLKAALVAAALPSHLLDLPRTPDLIGAAAAQQLQPWFRCHGSGAFANGVPVASALDYLRHFALIGARPSRSPYARGELVRLRRCLDQQLDAGRSELDYHSTWMVLQRL